MPKATIQTFTDGLVICAFMAIFGGFSDILVKPLIIHWMNDQEILIQWGASSAMTFTGLFFGLIVGFLVVRNQRNRRRDVDYTPGM